MKMYSITQLLSVDSVEKIQALNALGIYTIRDMAEYAGCRHAAFVMACFTQGNVEQAGLENYIEAAALTPDNLSKLNELEIIYLISVSDADAEQLGSAFGVETLSQLAEFPPYVEAQQFVLESIRGAYYEKPSAPPALIPKLIGSTYTQVRYSNYIKEKEYLLDDYELAHFADSDEPSPDAELIDIFYRARFKFYLGYLASIHQRWISDGTHLGDIVHSLALAPGESRNIAVLDWYHRQRSSRQEDTTASEKLQVEFTQTRAVNEVVQTTANEHLYGGTDVDSTTKTTGEGLVGGYGGGKAQSDSSGASAGLQSLAASDTSASLLSLGASGASAILQSMAGAIGGSLVHANGSVQGTLKSETTGERTVMGDVVQNISDATVQNASNVRSIMSTVVVEDNQAGRQRAQTRNVTNYNHSHALTVQYYEVLHSYRIDTVVNSLSPVLFLPFGPIDFNIEFIQSYWYLFRKAVKQVLPGRFSEFDQVVKDFNPENEAFDASGNLRITRVKITRTRATPQAVRVKMTDSNPEVTLAINGYDLDGCLSFTLTGSSTYIQYDILEQAVLDLNNFGAVDSFEIDEGIKANLSSDFEAELKRVMKQYLGDEKKTPKVADTNRADNELGLGSNREALKEDVDNNQFSILNNNDTIDLTIDTEYTVEDKNGQTQIVLETVRKTYTYGQLKGEIDEEIADVTTYINTQLATVADINPADVIAEIEQHFDFFKYSYTKYLLANAEKEQIIDIIDHLGIYGSTETLALTTLIDPNPLGLTENLLIFKLKEDAAGLKQQLGQNYTGTMAAPVFGKQTSIAGHGLRQSVSRNGRTVDQYRFWGQPLGIKPSSTLAAVNATLYVDVKPNQAGAYGVEGTIELVNAVGSIQRTNPVTLHGTADKPDGKALKIAYEASGAIPGGQQGTLDWTLDFPVPNNGEDVSAIVTDYARELQEYEGILRQRHHWTTVFLPSSGVFAEAILGLSNASEYLNVRRFFNWQDSPIPNLAPAIQAVNVNQDYAQPVPGSLVPTTPVSVLNQIAPQQYPMPTSLDSALQAIQNGSMFTDMSKTSELTAILGNLAQLANNTAQLSGNLAGDAAANALNAAVALGQQVASMVGAAMNTNVADPPKTLTQQGAATNYLDDVKQNSNGGPIAPTDQAGAGAMGTPIPPTGGSTGNGSTGGGTPTPSPVPTPTPPPVYNTSDSIAGTLSIRTALPDPYKYATVNLLEMMDSFIPDAVDQTLYDIYKTLKDLVISLGNDEEKKSQMVEILLTIGKVAEDSPWGIVIGMIIDLLTSETFIELSEDVVVLLYDVLYSFSHPYLGFAGAHDLGVWLSADIPYCKGKGKSAQVGSVASTPFNNVNYYIGGTPINAAPNPPTWGVEQLSGSILLPSPSAAAPKLTVASADDVSGNSVTVNVDADMEMLFDTLSIVQALRDDLEAELEAALASWNSTTKAAIEQAVGDWIAGLDSGSLDIWLGSLGLPSAAIDAIKAVLAAGGDLWGTAATFGIDVTTFVAGMVLSVFDYITGIKDLVSGPTKINYHLHLAATVAYNAAYPQGWKISVAGETSKFPGLTVSNADAAGAEAVVYSKNDVDPQGLLGLLLAYDAIPQISKYL